MMNSISKDSKATETESRMPNKDDNDLFAPGAAAYVRRAYPVWLGRHWWLLTIPGGLAIAAAWWPVCIFVALMVALLLYPSILLMVYLSYATSQRAVQWAYPRRVIMDDDGLWIRYAVENTGHIPEDCRIQWCKVRRVYFMGPRRRPTCPPALTTLSLWVNHWTENVSNGSRSTLLRLA